MDWLHNLKVAGIICEYNPIHMGHVHHIKTTRCLLGEESAIVCLLSGNFVQRGDFAVFRKHARAAAAIAAGADLVLELPVPYVLSSAEGFAQGGVTVLNALGVISALSFGSEEGSMDRLLELADCLRSPDLNERIVQELVKGDSYAAARQRAVYALLGETADVLSSPNNILAVEYLKALLATQSDIQPITVQRIGAAHNSDGAESASALRGMLWNGKEPWGYMPEAAATFLKSEIAVGRGPVFTKAVQAIMLSRLRMLPEEVYMSLPDSSEGLGHRLARACHTQPSIEAILDEVKTKRYAMSRLRRMVMCACLGVNACSVKETPSFIRVLAMNSMGRHVLRMAKEKSRLPIVTKPAEVRRLDQTAMAAFQRDAAATDFYTLAYPELEQRRGGSEWTTSPVCLE